MATGEQPNALDDCLSDVALYEYDADPEAMGTELVMNELILLCASIGTWRRRSWTSWPGKLGPAP
jgi:hypothetical protein